MYYSKLCPTLFQFSKIIYIQIDNRKYEPVHEKTNNLWFPPGLTQTGLYSHRRWLEAGNFGL